MSVPAKTFVNNSAPTCDAGDLNGYVGEINNAVLDSSQTLDDSDHTQLSKSIWNYWNSTRSYIIGSIVRKTATNELYQSLIIPNLNHALPSKISDSNWKYLGLLDNMFRSVTPTITAHSGGGQASAVILISKINRISVCAANGDSVVLPSVFDSGDDIIIINDGAFPCAVYPDTGGFIESLAVNIPFILQAGGRMVLEATTANSNWRITAYLTGSTYLITAHSGGGQASAVELVNGLNIITTCAASGNSVRLPANFNFGDTITIVNRGAKVANVFPATGQYIDTKAINLSIPVLPGCSVTLFGSTVNSIWTLIDGVRQRTNLITLDANISLASGSETLVSAGCSALFECDTLNETYIIDGMANITTDGALSSGAFNISGITTTAAAQAILCSWDYDNQHLPANPIVPGSSGNLTIQANPSVIATTVNWYIKFRLTLASQSII